MPNKIMITAFSAGIPFFFLKIWCDKLLFSKFHNRNSNHFVIVSTFATCCLSSSFWPSLLPFFSSWSRSFFFLLWNMVLIKRGSSPWYAWLMCIFKGRLQNLSRINNIHHYTFIPQPWMLSCKRKLLTCYLTNFIKVLFL